MKEVWAQSQRRENHILELVFFIIGGEESISPALFPLQNEAEERHEDQGAKLCPHSVVQGGSVAATDTQAFGESVY